MRAILILTAVLAGCAAPTQRWDTNSAAFKQCQYEAKAATPHTRNMFDDILREQELTNMCMQRGR